MPALIGSGLDTITSNLSRKMLSKTCEWLRGTRVRLRSKDIAIGDEDSAGGSKLRRDGGSAISSDTQQVEKLAAQHDGCPGVETGRDWSQDICGTPGSVPFQEIRYLL